MFPSTRTRNNQHWWLHEWWSCLRFLEWLWEATRTWRKSGDAQVCETLDEWACSHLTRHFRLYWPLLASNRVHFQHLTWYKLAHHRLVVNVSFSHLPRALLNCICAEYHMKLEVQTLTTFFTLGFRNALRCSSPKADIQLASQLNKKNKTKQKSTNSRGCLTHVCNQCLSVFISFVFPFCFTPLLSLSLLASSETGSRRSHWRRQAINASVRFNWDQHSNSQRCLSKISWCVLWLGLRPVSSKMTRCSVTKRSKYSGGILEGKGNKDGSISVIGWT